MIWEEMIRLSTRYDPTTTMIDSSKMNSDMTSASGFHGQCAHLQNLVSSHKACVVKGGELRRSGRVSHRQRHLATKYLEKLVHKLIICC